MKYSKHYLKSPPVALKWFERSIVWLDPKFVYVADMRDMGAIVALKHSFLTMILINAKILWSGIDELSTFNVADIE